MRLLRTKLESVETGKVEQDVEHFRPKASVKKWAGASKLPGIPFAAAPAPKTGYHLLPYHPFNYAAVTSSLTNQNFLVTKAGDGTLPYPCPGDGPEPLVNSTTFEHQPSY